MKQIYNFFQRIKESRVDSNVWIQSLALFLCVLMAVHLGDTAVAVNSSYGGRELPIYSVKTDDMKIAISFDAAWGDVI